MRPTTTKLRTHFALNKNTPDFRRTQRVGRPHRSNIPILGGLHHQYVRRLTKHIVRFSRLPAEAAVRVALVEGSSPAGAPESKNATC
jgi:hypothetical protein